MQCITHIGIIGEWRNLVISYNPGYQSLMKDPKQSTKQRFGGLDFDYPETALEVAIVTKESGFRRNFY
jgi:MoxR-like ATPase